MSIFVNWQNPYASREGNWYRGNLHTHTSPASGCGTEPVEQVLDSYRRKGYDFLAISDHKCMTVPRDNHLVLIPGMEWNDMYGGSHAGVYSLDASIPEAAIPFQVQEELLQFLADKDALVILNHPNWQLTPHYRRETLEARSPYDGIEIYNTVIERLDGYAISTDKWDYLLQKGRRVLGFASDDSHCEGDIGWGWNCVRAAERTPEAILRALREGNFYCSTGVNIMDIRRSGDTMEVETENADEIQVHANGGILLKRIFDHSASFTVPTDSPWNYIRFTAYGRGSAMAWTQPFFLK